MRAADKFFINGFITAIWFVCGVLAYVSGRFVTGTLFSAISGIYAALHLWKRRPHQEG